MRRPPLRVLLLLLALALGQWLSFAHATQHPALASDAACAVCVHAQGLDSAALSAVPVLPEFAFGTEAAAPPTLAAPSRPRSYCSIRGPPLLLV